jgi:hypothetical protein|uniref:Uncharacterized protein n=1 Tax=viral metagenome TaxID=1070528 RepID=A0A6C0F5B1_9ZZZZ|tara:strand:- start:642 stop:839 length:198 start_codon:yes stop_codon:yes gene_type:complete
MTYGDIEHKHYVETLSPYDRHIQLAFEKKIEVLMLYKTLNKSEEVYLNEESINKAIQWFTQNIKK